MLHACVGLIGFILAHCSRLHNKDGSFLSKCIILSYSAFHFSGQRERADVFMYTAERSEKNYKFGSHKNFLQLNSNKSATVCRDTASELVLTHGALKLTDPSVIF